MGRGRSVRFALLTAGSALIFAAGVPATASAVSFQRLKGFAAPGTPAKYDKVGVLKTGPKRAKNVLVLVPGTSAGAAYFEPLAKTIVRHSRGWQVWSVERRENLLEDQSMLDRVKAHKATAQQLYDYYLGFIDDKSVTKHFKFIPDSQVGFARGWGMRVEVEDLRRVVRAAAKGGRRVVLGGHSLGGSITTAYATWDFGGRAGGRGLSGLVYIDGGSTPVPIGEDEAKTSLQQLQGSTPWFAFGGVPTPFAGLLNSVGSELARIAPKRRSLLEHFSLLPANLRPPAPATNEAGYGYAVDSATSPVNLAAFQAHVGHLATKGSVRGWVRGGELTPIQRYAAMFSGAGLKGLDGTAWYHPRRLTMDRLAVADGNANPAQQVLDVRAIHGHALPRKLRIYAFAAALGGQDILNNARTLAQQSHIPRKQVKLIDRHETYAHNDPAAASPKNDFVQGLLPFLRRIAQGR
jgi:pimeloyl-ACP methyl ester carboxylesterase